MFSQKKLVLSLCAIASMAAVSCDDDGGSSNKAGSSCSTPLDCGDAKAFSCQFVDEHRICVNKDLCSNGKLDTDIGGAETDIDCGSMCGATCKLDQKCAHDTDCVSGLSCNSGKCGATKCTSSDECNGGTCDEKTGSCISCADGVKNGDESDVDCGGSCSAKCDAGKACTKNTDCSNSDCQNNKCSSTVLDTVAPKTLLINEVMGAPDAKKFFGTQPETAQTEFVEIVNLSNTPAKLDGLYLNTFKFDSADSVQLEIPSATTKHIPLSGIIPAKGVLVVSEAAIPMPEDGINMHMLTPETKVTLAMTNGSPYALWIANEAGDTSDLAIRAGISGGKSQNRSADLSNASPELVKHDSVSTLNSSPGYCANGDLISSGCTGSGSGGGGERTDLELVDISGLVINEILDSGSKTPNFAVSGTEQKACEFVEIANTSDKEVKLGSVSLVLEQLDTAAENAVKTTSAIKLNGVLPAKNIVVVSSCTDNGIDEINLPSTARAIPAGTTKLFTGTWTYNMYLQSSDGTNTVKSSEIKTFAIGGIVNTSYNRETDFSSSASLAKTTDLMSSNADDFKYFATPGYCANGGIYSEDCVLTCNNGKLDGSETDTDCGGSCAKCAESKTCKVNSDCASDNCEGGKCAKSTVAPDRETIDVNKLLINEVFDSGAKSPVFTVSGTEQKACEFIEIANISNEELNLESVSLVLDQMADDGSVKTSKSIQLDGSIQPKHLIVVSSCTNSSLDEISLPASARAIPAGSTKLITGTWTYNMYLQSSNNIETIKGNAITNLPIKSVVNSSYNREVDFSSSASMKLTTDLIKDNADGFKYFATPGYCANGGLFVEDCAVSSSSPEPVDTCKNGVKDGDETDTDCGGSCSNKCGENQKCKNNDDCSAPYACWYGGVCAFPEDN